jgi:hypothetical protein
MRKALIGIILFSFVFIFTACKSKEVKTVEELIVAIGETISEESVASIMKAKESYDNLSTEDKEKVKNYQTLEESEKQMNLIYSKKVDRLILEIGEINEGSLQLIETARHAYDKLTKKQQSFVENIGELIRAENRYDDYMVEKTIELLTSMSNITIVNKDIIENAENMYSKLTEEQKKRVSDSVGEVEALFTKAKIDRVISFINGITYKKDEPNKDDLNQMIVSLTYYQSLDIATREEITNYKMLETATKGFDKYLEKLQKSDKLLIRENYINECEMVSYEDLFAFPKSYEDKKLSFNITINGIQEAKFLTAERIVAIITDTDDYIELKDKRSIKEPVIEVGNSFIIYGIYDEMKTIKEKEEGTGLFGSNFFSKVKDENKVPVIEFEYASIDNLGVISTGDPNAIITEIDEEIVELRNQLDELIKNSEE